MCNSKKIAQTNIERCVAELKGYLRYKSIFCHKVALDVRLMNFFI